MGARSHRVEQEERQDRLPIGGHTWHHCQTAEAEGQAAWRRFNAGREDQLWYYRELVDALREAGGLEDLVEELDEVVGEIQQS
jgi:hypothetical protein